MSSIKKSVLDGIYLTACSIHEISPDRDLVEKMDLGEVFHILSAHQLETPAAYALDALGIEDERFIEARDEQIRKYIIFELDQQCVVEALEAAKIRFIPLKGAVIKDYYPQAAMRQMSDHDILFDPARADDVRDIMESLGFSTIHFGAGHQDDYQKPPLSHFEMHRTLFSERSRRLMHEYFSGEESRLLADAVTTHCMSNEDFYCYMIAHTYKHYYWNGTGLRSLLDVYVFLRRFQDSLDWNHLAEVFRKLEISEFESTLRALSFHVFEEGIPLHLSEAENSMLLHLCQSGAYGNREVGIKNKVERLGKLRYLWRRIFLSSESIQCSYPFFFRHKILLPLLPIYRLARGTKKLIKEFRILLRQ